MISAAMIPILIHGTPTTGSTGECCYAVAAYVGVGVCVCLFMSGKNNGKWIKD